MAEANREEADKCKRVAQSALAEGNKDKAIRFLEKARRMSNDPSLDELLAKAKSFEPTEASSTGEEPPSSRAQTPQYRSSQSSGGGPSPSVGASGTGSATRTNKQGQQYTGEQMQEVQRILRTKDYYAIFGLDRNADEKQVTKAYKKLALKLHPDKNHAPGAEEAFKKVSKALQCLTDADKKHVYDQYGDEDHIPQQHRYHQHQNFMTPEDLFASFFFGGPMHHNQHAQRHQSQEQGGEGAQRAPLFHVLPVLLLVLLTFASNFASNNNTGRFSFTRSGQYQNERATAELNAKYWVANDFENHYMDGTKLLADFERQVEIYHVRNKHSECDYEEKVMYKKVMQAKRRGGDEEVQKARNHPRPACKELERIKRRHQNIYRSAMYMGF